MKNRFILFQRSGVFYCEDTTTGKQTSLRTRDKADAVRLLHVKNEATHQPAMNLQIAQVYLQHGDPAMATRTWQEVMAQIVTTKRGSTQVRWQTAIKDKALDGIRDRKLIQTLPEHFLTALQSGGGGDQRLLAAHSSFCGVHALAAVARVAEASLAPHSI